MSHPLVLALFDDAERAAAAARALRPLGVEGDRLSIVAATHDREDALAHALGASPGAEIEDSRGAARLGELGAHLLAAVAVVLPGIGPILAGGPLAAEFGEAAGHIAGSVAGVLRDAGVDEARALVWQEHLRAGAVLLGAHVLDGDADAVRRALEGCGPRDSAMTEWE
jgi:hypothetical protein